MLCWLGECLFPFTQHSNKGFVIGHGIDRGVNFAWLAINPAVEIFIYFAGEEPLAQNRIIIISTKTFLFCAYLKCRGSIATAHF